MRGKRRGIRGSGLEGLIVGVRVGVDGIPSGIIGGKAGTGCGGLVVHHLVVGEKVGIEEEGRCRGLECRGWERRDRGTGRGRVGLVNTNAR